MASSRLIDRTRDGFGIGGIHITSHAGSHSGNSRHRWESLSSPSGIGLPYRQGAMRKALGDRTCSCLPTVVGGEPYRQKAHGSTVSHRAWDAGYARDCPKRASNGGRPRKERSGCERSAMNRTRRKARHAASGPCAAEPSRSDQGLTEDRTRPSRPPPAADPDDGNRTRTPGARRRVTLPVSGHDGRLSHARRNTPCPFAHPACPDPPPRAGRPATVPRRRVRLGIGPAAMRAARAGAPAPSFDEDAAAGRWNRRSARPEHDP